jgi:hypothetical protein
MSKLTSIDDLISWILSLQKQDANFVYWTLYSGSEVVSAKALLRNAVITVASDSNALLVDTIRRYGKLGGDFTVFMTDKEKNNTGFKANLLLLPESQQVQSGNLGIHGLPSIQAVQETIQDKVLIATLQHQIQALNAAPTSVSENFIGRIMGLADKAPEKALELGAGIFHRILGLAEKGFWGDIIPPPPAHEVPAVSIGSLPRQTETLPQEAPEAEIEVINHQNNTIVMKSQSDSLAVLEKIFGMPPEVMLDALSEYMQKNEVFAKPLILQQIKPYLKAK